jgi:hypothetical protein
MNHEKKRTENASPQFSSFPRAYLFSIKQWYRIARRITTLQNIVLYVVVDNPLITADVLLSRVVPQESLSSALQREGEEEEESIV